MADIQTLMKQLLSAVYGKEVRQAIHDAIEQCYADGKAGSIDLIARQQISTNASDFNKKIEELTSDILELQETGVTAEVIEAKVSSTIQEMIADGTMSGMTLADGSVTQAKLAPDVKLGIADGEVTPEKFSGYTKAPNLFAISEINLKHTTVDSTFSETIKTGYLTEFISVPVGQTTLWGISYLTEEDQTDFSWKWVNNISIQKSAVYCYDSEYNFLGYATAGNISALHTLLKLHFFDLLENTSYIKVWTRNPDEYMSTPCFASLVCHTSLVGLEKYPQFVSDDTVMEGCGLIPVVKNNNMFHGNEFARVQFPSATDTQHGFPDKGNYSVYPIEVSEQDYYVRVKFVEWNSTGNYAYISFWCYDENMNYVGLVNHSNASNDYGTWEFLDGSASDLYVKVHFTSLVKYVRYNSAGLDSSQEKLDTVANSLVMLNHEFEADYSPVSYSDEFNEIFEAKLNELNKEGSHYQFRQIGRIVSKLPVDYVCWNFNFMRYDANTDKYVLLMKGQASHSGGSGKSVHFVTIDANTLKASEPVQIIVNEQPLVSCGGIVIASDGTYYMLGSYEDSGSTAWTSLLPLTHRLHSDDQGATWIDDGVVVIDTDDYFISFCSMELLSTGRLLGFTDNKPAVTNIAYSDDYGLNWTLVTVPTVTSENNCSEQTVIEIDGTLMMIGRYHKYPTEDYPAQIAYSYDYGETWTALTDSQSLTAMSSSTATGYVHDGIVEVFCCSRQYNQLNGCTGKISHYSATIKQALNDDFRLREVFYSFGNIASNFHAPSSAIDGKGRALVTYADSQYGSDVTEQYFLQGSYSNNTPVVCDGRASDILPYSGAKIERLIIELKEELGLS